jgi:group II intron reverse transcriptase/maturase
MNVRTKQQRIAELARHTAGEGIKSLNHYIDLDWMREAYRRTRKDGATGVDKVTSAEYEEHLEENLRSLLERLKSGSYHAPAVRRVYIPKGDKGGEKRPIGIPTLEDKILQRAICMVLEPIFEEDFQDCSYGFRPGRSVHQTLEMIGKTAVWMLGCWVLEVDIRKYFDTVKHDHLRAFYKQRVCDGVIRRILGKWLKAGVMEDGTLSYPEDGTPQGGVVSPLLSNIYLHEVLDKWFEEEIKPRLTGRAVLVRYADDFVIMFETEYDARRVQNVLWKRFGRFGLTLHAEKTRLVYYGPPYQKKTKGGTFSFLGFTHYWGKSRKGKWIPKRKTSKERLKRSIRRIHLWCKANRHRPVKEQWQELERKVRGHYQFYGITNNSKSINQYHIQVERSWRKWLDRRNREKHMTWEKFRRMQERYPVPEPRIVHSYITK